MRVAVVAGPDPGHAFPAIALCEKFRAAGDEPVLFTGTRWLEPARAAGITVRPLKGLAPRPGDDDEDAGQRIHNRAAHVATELLPDLSVELPELVVSDILTAGGGMAAEKLDVPWVELSPHPLYRASVGLPPIGSGLEPGVGWRGRLRDSMMRAATGRSIRQGDKQRGLARVGIGLPAEDPGPAARLIATLPALEVPRPDWPEETYIVGPLLWEPTDAVLEPPSGDKPLVVIAPSTAWTGAPGMVEKTVAALSDAGVRVVVSMIDPPPSLPDNVVAGLGRQDLLLREAAVGVGGGGHGLLAKTLLSGTPMVVVPGGGDQWELANRAARQGSAAVIVRPLEQAAVREAVLRVLADPAFTAAAVRAADTLAEVADPVEICRRVLTDRKEK